jgi:hypothetical protein
MTYILFQFFCLQVGEMEREKVSVLFGPHLKFQIQLQSKLTTSFYQSRKKPDLNNNRFLPKTTKILVATIGN